MLEARGGRGDFAGARNEVGPVDDPVKAINQNVTDDYYGNTYYIDRDPYLPYVNSQRGCVRMVCDASQTKCSQVNVCELYNNYNNY